MAEQGTTDISLNDMKTLVSESVAQLSTVCLSSNINKWSFYRSRPIQINATTKLIEFAADPGEYHLGDFRRYNHTALTPSTATGYTQYYDPFVTTFTMTLATYIERLNVKEIMPSTTMYFTVKYYLTTAARAAESGSIRTYTVALSLTTETPPTGHTNDQTQAPASSFQLIQDTGFVKTSIVQPDDIVYCDTFISDVSGNVLARFDDSYTTINTHERQTPYIVGTGIPDLSPPSGYSFVQLVINNSPTICAGSNQNQTQGSGSSTFYVHLVGQQSASPYEWRRLGSTSITMRLVVTNPSIATRYYTLNATSLSSTGNTYETTSDLWGSSDTWEWDDVATAEIVSGYGTITEGASVCAP